MVGQDWGRYFGQMVARYGKIVSCHLQDSHYVELGSVGSSVEPAPVPVSIVDQVECSVQCDVASADAVLAAFLALCGVVVFAAHDLAVCHVRCSDVVALVVHDLVEYLAKVDDAVLVAAGSGLALSLVHYFDDASVGTGRTWTLVLDDVAEHVLAGVALVETAVRAVFVAPAGVVVPAVSAATAAVAQWAAASPVSGVFAQLDEV